MRTSSFTRPGLLLLLAAGSLLGAGCARTAGPVSRPYPEMVKTFEAWAEQQNVVTSAAKARPPFPGWGPAVVERSEGRSTTLLLEREWVRAGEKGYEKKTDAAFITVTPQPPHSYVNTQVLTRDTLMELPPRAGKADREKTVRIFRRVLALLGRDE